MRAEGFFDNLGQRIGQWMLEAIEWFERTLNWLAGPLIAFFRGWMRTTGIQPTLFNLMLLLIALGFVLIALRALFHAAYFNAALWLAAGALVLGWLISN